MSLQPFSANFRTQDATLQRDLQDLIGQLNRPGVNEKAIVTALWADPILGKASQSFRAYKIGATSVESWYEAGRVNASAGTTTAPAIDTLWAIPEVFTTGFGIDQLAFNVTTLAAGGKGRVGVYSSTNDIGGDPYPDKLIYDGGEYSTAATGVMQTAVQLNLTPGAVYWFVYLAGVAAATIRAVPSAAMWPYFGSVAGMGTVPTWGLKSAFSYAALPAAFPASPSAVVSAAAPAVAYRLNYKSTTTREVSLPTGCIHGGGWILRRVRLVKASVLQPNSNANYVTITANVIRSAVLQPVGSFDSRAAKLTAWSPYTISGNADIDRTLAADDVLEVHVVQGGWPKIDLADAFVQWDLAYRGA